MKGREVLRWGGVFLGLLMAALGAQEKQPAPPKAPFIGVLVRADLNANTLVVKRARAGEVTVHVTPQTQVLIADEPGRLADLKEGQRVEVSVRVDPQGRWVAQWIRDAQTIAIREAESTGTPATIVRVSAPEKQIVVRTQAGKERTLTLQTEGAWAGRVMKKGKPASLGDFQAGEAVWVSLRRTLGKTIYLKALADEETFLAFLLEPTVKGVLSNLNPAERSFQLTVEGQPPLSVRWTSRTRIFLQGKAATSENLSNGATLFVVLGERVKGVTTARALFDEQSWPLYAQAVKESLQKKPAPPKE